jgi:hypothetical protein
MLATLEGECSRFFVPGRSAIRPWVIVEIAIIRLTAQDPSVSGYSYAMDVATMEIRRITG